MSEVKLTFQADTEVAAKFKSDARKAGATQSEHFARLVGEDVPARWLAVGDQSTETAFMGRATEVTLLGESFMRLELFDGDAPSPYKVPMLSKTTVLKWTILEVTEAMARSWGAKHKLERERAQAAAALVHFWDRGVLCKQDGETTTSSASNVTCKACLEGMRILAEEQA